MWILSIHMLIHEVGAEKFLIWPTTMKQKFYWFCRSMHLSHHFTSFLKVFFKKNSSFLGWDKNFSALSISILKLSLHSLISKCFYRMSVYCNKPMELLYNRENACLDEDFTDFVTLKCDENVYISLDYLNKSGKKSLSYNKTKPCKYAISIIKYHLIY